MKRRYLGLFLLALLGGSTAATGVAHADTVTCGQVITHDTVLTADVGPCPGTGIIIGASNITLDLGGHTVFGAPSNAAAGILVEAPFSTTPSPAGVRLRNGTVTGFRLGVSIVRSVDNTVERLLVAGNLCHGIELLGTGSGGPFPATRNLVRDNVVQGNGCSGVHLLQNASGNVVERNNIVGNAGAGVFLEQLGPNNTPRNNTIRQNVIRGNGGNGITEMGFFNSFTGNVITANALDGIRIGGGLGAGGSVVQANQILGNGGNGVLIQAPRFDNQVLGNTATGNAVFDLADENFECQGNTWAGNTFGTRNQPCIS